MDLFILQTQALNANDIMFRVTDVVFIVSGVITLLTAWFAFKSAQSKTEDRITLEVSKGDEKRAAIIREFEILTDKYTALEEKIKVAEKSFDALESNLYRRIEEIDKSINKFAIESQKNISDLSVAVSNMKSEILQRLFDKK